MLELIALALLAALLVVALEGALELFCGLLASLDPQAVSTVVNASTQLVALVFIILLL